MPTTVQEKLPAGKVSPGAVNAQVDGQVMFWQGFNVPKPRMGNTPTFLTENQAVPISKGIRNEIIGSAARRLSSSMGLGSFFGVLYIQYCMGAGAFTYTHTGCGDAEFDCQKQSGRGLCINRPYLPEWLLLSVATDR